MKPVEKSREKVSCCGELAEGAGERDALLVDAVIADGGAEAEFGGFRRLGDDVDDAAGRVGAVHGGARAAHHLDARDGIERDGNIHIVMAGLGVVEALAVEQDERLAEARRREWRHRPGRRWARARGSRWRDPGEGGRRGCSGRDCFRGRGGRGWRDRSRRARAARSAGDDDGFVLLSEGRQRGTGTEITGAQVYCSVGRAVGPPPKRCMLHSQHARAPRRS